MLTTVPEAPAPSAALARVPWEWVPCPILAGLVVTFQAMGFRSPHEIMGFLVNLNLVLGMGLGLVTAGFLAGYFLLRGAPGYLLLGGGLVIWGLTGSVAAMAAQGHGNLLLTLHDTALWAGSVCHLAGVILEARGLRWVRRLPESLVLAALAALGFIALVLMLARQGWVVTFFAPGHGGTPWVRQFLLGSGMACFAASALILKQWGRDGAMRRWYPPGLWCIVVGLGAIALGTAPDSAVGWVGRSSVSVGFIYLALGAWGALGTARAEAVVATVWNGQRLGLLLAPILVVAAAVLRLVFLEALASTFAFITFFPAVALAALLGGLRAGVLATVLSGVGATYFWLASGRFTLPRTGEWLGFLFSLVSCVLLSFILEAMHRAQAKALEAEARERTAAVLAQGAEELRRTVEELTRSNRDLEQFAYVASHDLQEPLRMVHAYVDLFAQRYRGRLDAQGDQYLAFALEGAARMQALIHDLLTYSRVGAPGVETLAEVSLQTCLEEAMVGLQASLAASGGQVTSDPLPRVVADPIQVARIFSNLVGNSLKFKGRDLPRIHVGARTTDTEVVVSVADNGIGIEPKAHLKVFDIFIRLHNRDIFPGTGIGLAVCRKIVERHGGRIWVESTPGSGATFFFTLSRPQGGTP